VRKHNPITLGDQVIDRMVPIGKCSGKLPLKPLEFGPVHRGGADVTDVVSPATNRSKLPAKPAFANAINRRIMPDVTGAETKRLEFDLRRGRDVRMLPTNTTKVFPARFLRYRGVPHRDDGPPLIPAVRHAQAGRSRGVPATAIIVRFVRRFADFRKTCHRLSSQQANGI
jgi:hypothetical protein